MIKAKSLGVTLCSRIKSLNGGCVLFSCCLGLFCLLFANSHAALAQTMDSGTIQGRVTDPTGAVIPGASVQITEVETAVTTPAATDGLGRYFVPSLRVGEYTVTVSQKGFKTVRRAGIILQVNQFAEIDFTLEVGAVAQEIQVTGAAPLIQTTDATIGQVIDSQQTTTLPLNGRSYAQLAYLTPTVVPGQGCCPTAFAPTFGTTGGFSIGGTRGEDEQFTVDGLSATNDFVGGTYIYPSIDAIEEFKIVQNSYMPELGTRAGQVLLVSKGGTNTIHGDVFEFVRNNWFDARNTFSGPEPPLRLNQFGGTIGGPIRKDKTFGFFSYEGTRQEAGTTESVVQPDAAMREGNFSELLPTTQLLAPVNYPGAGLLAGQPIPGNRIDLLNSSNPGAVNPISLNIINMTGYPLPNSPGNIYTISPTVPFDMNFFQGRLDHNVSEKDRLWGSYYLERSTTKGEPFTTLPKEVPITTNNSQQIGATWNHVFRPNLMNEVRGGFNFVAPATTNGALPSLTGVSQQDLGFPLNSYQPVLGQSGIMAGIPNFAITGYGSTGASGGSQPSLYRTVHYELVDSLNYVHGAHRLGFGFDFLRDHQDQRFDPQARGLYNFTGQYTENGFADFLLGFPTSTGREINFTGQQILESLDRENQWSGYAQDSWQIRPNLSIDFGLRYDYFRPPLELRGRVANYIPRGQDIVRVEGTGGHGGSLSDSGTSLGTQGFDLDQNCACTKQKKDFAPRLAFAWRPLGSQRTVIRAGAGIFYARVTYNEQQSIRFNPPWVFRQSFVNGSPVQLGGSGPGGTITEGFESGLQPQTYGGFATSPDLKDMTLQQWSFEVQHQISNTLMASITYVGSEMYHGDNNIPLNQANPGPGPLEPRRPFSGVISPQDDPDPPATNFLVYSWGENGATSNYNAVTFLVRKQYAQGLTFLAHFTWSKSLDNGSSVVSSNQNPYDIAADRGLSLFNEPYRFIATWIYELPFGSGKHFLSHGGRVLNTLVGGWQVTSILDLESGYAANPTVSENLSNTDGFSTLRPDRVCSGKLSNPNRNEWFNPSCFPLQTPYTWGNAGRDTIQVPGIHNLDGSIIKTFPIHEKQHIDFRAEFFNAFNFTNLGAPVTDSFSPSDGQIFSAANGRELQFALKYVF